MKQKIDWKMFFLFLVVCGGLYILTHSFFMSLGILLLLFVGENFYNEYRDRHRRKDK
ncbi:MAG: transporter [Prevotella sp.]|jgi:1,4-dihydroxy-2-naphthoate octaprenyltransferase|nr:transporter [Prevotella sp.]MCI2079975.1 transporter [Prevotella sp.]MCI2101777.1 transporter [Prevotella sp.]HCN52899.1 transporter [Prevotella sp.]